VPALRRARLAGAAALLAGLAPAAAGHDVPSDVRVLAFLKPEGERLQLVARVPLAAMRDVAYPVRGSGYLDLAGVEAPLREAVALWLLDALELYEGGARLERPRVVAVRISLPSDRSFERYDKAVAHVTGPPLPVDTLLFWNQGMLDVWLEYRIRSQASGLSIRPGLERLGVRVLTVLRFLPPGGAERAFELAGDPGRVELDPRWHQAALRFVRLGFLHILDGIDHLLFLLCLVIPFRRLGALVLVVTAFTAAHSVTLIASALGAAPDALWFPPLIEVLIALSIVYMALENIVAPRLRRRWLLSFGFGLVHGFGFSFALHATLQFAGSHLLGSLLAFNVGVELGQLLVLLALLPLLELLFRFVVAERVGTILLSAFVAHTGWHWMLERWERLRQFPLEWPAPSAGEMALAGRGLILAVALAGLVWLARAMRAARARGSSPAE
jgi:hypothetical protein